MPPYMAIPHYHLSKLPATTKVALTGFCLATLAGILFVLLGVFYERTAFRNDRVKANFAGDERVTAETGVVFKEMHAEPSRRALYDVVHPHSFMIPLIYFTLTHLMEMSYASFRAKMTLYVLGALSMLVVTFAPLLVSWKLALSPLVLAAVWVQTATFTVMTVVPPWQMWFGEGRRPQAPDAPRA